ncbi:MAG: hypothetical protein RI894_1586 [Bacteroidota bacterium]|jgi:hypothetical protein
MKKIFFFIGSYFILIQLHAQPNIDKKRDFVWLTGYENVDFGQRTYYGTTITDFGSCELTQYSKQTNIDFTASSASICDTSGKLMFYTNGNTIEDSTGQIMQNGDSLSFPDYQYPTGSYVPQGSLILPLGDGYNYVILHPPGVEYDAAYTPAKPFFRTVLLTRIDMRGNNGKGAIISKNIPILYDTCRGPYARACRHANGRDWWVLRLNKNLSKCYRLLISPYGIDSLPPLTLPFVADTAAFSAGVNVSFSPDGRQFAQHSGTKLWLYDFDRCAGVLSNRRIFYRNRDFFSGIAFSPNSRYLYISRDTTVTQYDTYAIDINASKIIVARWDSTYTTIDNWQAANKFFQPVLAPNGKIYINCPGTHIVWHVINNPDAAGLACDVQQHAIRLPTWYYATTPNLPNFRLGAERGTVCDSLGIEESAPYICVQNTTTSNPEKQEVKVRLYPNPAANELTLDYADWQHKKVIITDLVGRTEKILSLQSESNKFDISTLQNGVHYVSIYDENRLVYCGKLVVLR